MLKLRVVYPEEELAYKRLFFLITDRNLDESEHHVEDGYLYVMSDISHKLNQILDRFQTETIWAPIWLEGSARGLFSDHASDINIPWSMKYGPVVFVDRNYYLSVLELAKQSRTDYIYSGDMDIRRLVTGKITAITSEMQRCYPIPEDFKDIFKSNAARVFECYLLGWDFFILPAHPNLKEYVADNYRKTISRRIPGGRKIVQFADLGYAVTLDSGDELASIFKDNIIAKTGRLMFPPNPDFEEDDQILWQAPIKMGEEDLHFELSYYRETGKVDSEYWQYREEKILELDDTSKEIFLNKLVKK